jgi:hypothetical protein
LTRFDDPGDALGDHALDPGGFGGVDQVAGAVDAQFGIPHTHSTRKVGELVDDGVGLGGDDRGQHGVTIERIEQDRMSAELSDIALPIGAAGSGEDGMPGCHEQGNELATDGAGSTGEEDAHASPYREE